MNMASFVVSPVIRRLLETCALLIQHQRFPLFPGYYDAVEKLSRSLISLQPTVSTAEANQYEDDTLKDWLSRLTKVAYDAEHELDTIATEFQLMSGRDVSQIDSSHIQNLSLKIEQIAEEKQRLDLLFTVKSNDSQLRGSLHMDYLGDTGFFGREREKDEIVDLMLCEKSETCGKNVAVIGINGTGGVGKTTLAHLILNDERVKRCFEQHVIWVSLAQGCILPGILQGIRGFSSNITCDKSQYSGIEILFKEFVAGKRFLVILDNLSFMNHADQIHLLQLLELGMKGSKLLYTSRTPHEIDGETSFLLKPLSMENCWTLFKTIAFDDYKPLRSDLAEIGEAMVAKCKGLPLSVKVLASLLRGNADLEDWKRVDQSRMWKLDQPALQLCYYNLPSHLKECLLSCSSFPKDHVFNKKELAKIWMAQGFIPMGDKDDAEDIGLKYFDEMLRRCFFQFFEIGKDDGMRYTVHDVIYEFVEMNSCFPKNRHMLEMIEYHYTIPREELFFQQNASVKFLRVLDLSSSSIVSLPGYIEKCKLLRYLDLSMSSVFGLPDSVCNLYNLQTLRLLHCPWLEELPRDLYKLSKLRHLEMDKPNWRYFSTWPAKLGNLTGLRTLSVYKVGLGSGYEIEGLKDMENLTGSLNISCLENAVNAKEVNLKAKKRLRKLVFEWSEKINDKEYKEESDVSILEDLSPNENILELGIVNYRSNRFPNWMTDGALLQNLAVLSLDGCVRFKVLDLDLPMLRKLSIKGMEELEEISNLQCPVLNELEMVDCAIHSLPKDGVPASVEFIRIQRCWKLYDRCQKETGSEWPKIAHIPRQQIRQF